MHSAPEQEEQSRSPESFDSWVAQHWDALHAGARQHADAWTDADLLLTDTLKKVAGILRTRPMSDELLLRYTLRSIRNAAHRAHRSNLLRLKAENHFGTKVQEQQRPSPLERHEQREAMQRLLKSLREPHASIVRLYLWEDVSFADIALRLGLGERSVRRYYAAALDTLRKKLRRRRGAVGGTLLLVLVLAAWAWVRPWREEDAASMQAALPPAASREVEKSSPLYEVREFPGELPSALCLGAQLETRDSAEVITPELPGVIEYFDGKPSSQQKNSRWYAFGVLHANMDISAAGAANECWELITECDTGMETRPLTAEERRNCKLPLREDIGVLIYRTTPGGAAEKAGLRAGDIIATMTAVGVVGRSEQMVLLRNLDPGDTLYCIANHGEGVEFHNIILTKRDKPAQLHYRSPGLPADAPTHELRPRMMRVARLLAQLHPPLDELQRELDAIESMLGGKAGVRGKLRLTFCSRTSDIMLIRDADGIHLCMEIWDKVTKGELRQQGDSLPTNIRTRLNEMYLPSLKGPRRLPSFHPLRRIINTPRQVQGEQALRAHYHTPLAGILVFVHNKASADAAAPRVAALLASPEGRDAVLRHEYLHYLYYRFDCFGSRALQDALVPMLNRLESPSAREFRRRLRPSLASAYARMEEMTDVLNSVVDDASAKRAAAILRTYTLKNHHVLIEATTKAQNGLLLTNTDYQLPLGVRDRAEDRFYHAWMRLRLRCKDCLSELQQALHFTLADVRVHPPMSAAQQEKRGQILAAMHEWLDVAAGIHDKASADAAADWLERRNAALGVRLQDVRHEKSEKRESFRCICLEQLTLILEAAHDYLAFATPRYFGSEKLRRQLGPAIRLPSNAEP